MAPSGSRRVFSPGPWGSRSRTPVRRSRQSWFPRSSSRFSGARNASAPTTQASASAWRSSRASPRHTTEPSLSLPAPLAVSASRCSYLPHRTRPDDGRGQNSAGSDAGGIGLTHEVTVLRNRGDEVVGSRGASLHPEQTGIRLAVGKRRGDAARLEKPGAGAKRQNGLAVTVLVLDELERPAVGLQRLNGR